MESFDAGKEMREVGHVCPNLGEGEPVVLADPLLHKYGTEAARDSDKADEPKDIHVDGITEL